MYTDFGIRDLPRVTCVDIVFLGFESLTNSAEKFLPYARSLSAAYSIRFILASTIFTILLSAPKLKFKRIPWPPPAPIAETKISLP